MHNDNKHTQGSIRNKTLQKSMLCNTKIAAAFVWRCFRHESTWYVTAETVTYNLHK